MANATSTPEISWDLFAVDLDVAKTLVDAAMSPASPGPVGFGLNANV
jgi:hypothetical protein